MVCNRSYPDIFSSIIISKAIKQRVAEYLEKAAQLAITRLTFWLLCVPLEMGKKANKQGTSSP